MNKSPKSVERLTKGFEWYLIKKHVVWPASVYLVLTFLFALAADLCFKNGLIILGVLVSFAVLFHVGGVLYAISSGMEKVSAGVVGAKKAIKEFEEVFDDLFLNKRKHSGLSDCGHDHEKDIK